ncbi:hydroxysteroid dehydrogenase-like protein 1 isoform X1 [Drosophila mauritiana]|uniref:Hydroxysteroid dehydrogenase-like protein 1 isoform X1 n=1 Tax=Drosophila mauritiana TaxID=7226 RepID=A0A6P8LAQ3_DROMA|nr:hydroxysteroid dehydrogenase-like protein 1 isoform X1 [Drosophila mauritiana]XP_033172675.1 hydroxysteroid dehydrogenase-like protein 1 isoform X1 [Drosophila mauritiana]
MALILQVISSGIYIVGSLSIVAFLYDNLKSLFSIIKAVLEPYFRPNLPKTLVEKFGQWAVVTGATDGIGKEYARELARQGLNLVLISRTKEKLIAVTNEIESQYNVKIKWIVVDFAKGREVYDQIEEELNGIDVGILVNNVGMIHDPETLDKVSEDTLWDLLTVNMGSVTMLTRKILPQMIGRRKGAIVNLGSSSELQPLPNLTAYAASKKFITHFSKGLEYEVADHNIHVQLVMPNFVATNMNAYSDKVRQGGLLFPNAYSYARSAVFTLGKTSETNGFWVHGIQYALRKLAPMQIRTYFGHQLFKRLRIEALEHRQKKQNLY